MPHFGPGVIGQKAYDEQNRVEQSGSLVFGPAVLNHHFAQKQAEARAAHQPEPVGEAETPGELAPVAPVEAPVPEIESFSVRDIKELLKGDSSTAALDRVMLAEFQRPDGARKSALEYLHQTESRRKDPRAEVLGALDAKLEEVG